MSIQQQMQAQQQQAQQQQGIQFPTSVGDLTAQATSVSEYHILSIKVRTTNN